LHAGRSVSEKPTPEQKRLRSAAEVAGDWYGVAETDQFVEELCLHFPGLAPAIRVVAYHAEDKMASSPNRTVVQVHVGQSGAPFQR
jgi:hypothetical protein